MIIPVKTVWVVKNNHTTKVQVLKVGCVTRIL